MKPTQNDRGGWREPDPQNTGKFITPEAEKSLRDGAGRYRFIKADGENAAEKSKNAMSAKANKDAVNVDKNNKNNTINKREQPQKAPQKLSLKDAVRSELKERLGGIFSGISVDAEDMIKGLICAALIMLAAMVQTTFFSKFPIFGTVPDLMLSVVAAIAVSEGEKWGGVCGLCAAFVIQSLGNSGTGPELLALVYMPAGYIIGILSGSYFSNSLPVKAIYITSSSFGRAIASAITAAVMLDASFGKILADIVIPEYFATVVAAPAVYFIVWLSLKHFHKTRAERTDAGGAS